MCTRKTLHRITVSSPRTTISHKLISWQFGKSVFTVYPLTVQHQALTTDPKTHVVISSQKSCPKSSVQSGVFSQKSPSNESLFQDFWITKFKKKKKKWVWFCVKCTKIAQNLRKIVILQNLLRQEYYKLKIPYLVPT